MSRKLTIAVLFGGRSPEHGVSLQSAAAILRHMDRERYEPVMVGISQSGDWFHYTGPVSSIEDGSWNSGESCARAALSPSRSCSALLVLEEQAARQIPLDAVFPVLHGRDGEDGTVQGLIELAGIPLAGCGVLSSALCMDKDRAHQLVRSAGIDVPESFVVKRADREALERAETIGYPLFVKPLRAGSSFGITKVTEKNALPAALETAFAYDSQVIVEECVPGFEVGCAVLGNDTLTVGEPDEIQLSGDFFDYTEKYTLKTSAIHVPARVIPDQRRRIQEMSFHEDLFAGIMRFHLNTINYVGLPKTTSPTYFSLFKSLEIVSRLHVALPVGEETPMRANASEIFPGLLPFMN